ncbi:MULTISPECIES: alpha/beta hydrolase [unclassified Variovorax]|uniref:alpha/beta fold hydrolase n=1 Tax=unclassified Variovorax TaxID=663243 RepID=UPI001E5AFF07|nr:MULTISPECIES: alpha/beta hydrolase [unclassified Variovorax]
MSAPGHARHAVSRAQVAQRNLPVLEATVQVLIVVTLLLGATLLGSCTRVEKRISRVEIGFLQIDSEVQLRRMIVRSSRPRGSVLFLHGFPETLYAWKDIALALADDYEVHAFDWPGFGLSARPPIEKFSYAPKDYARVLKEYIRKSNLDASSLTIYATDIGALPALLLALEEPGIAQAIIVGDFAPLNRPQYMAENLQALKAKPSSDLVRAALNKNRDEILENAFRRGLTKNEQFELSQELKDDMLRGWNHGSLTTADAFYHYYAHFTRDQEYFEANLNTLRTPVRIVWGEKDFYIKKEMGLELAQKAKLQIQVLANIGHYPHLQDPRRTIEDVRAFSGSGRRKAVPGASAR